MTFIPTIARVAITSFRCGARSPAATALSSTDGPVLESIELYEKKSGGELLGQLFDFTDKGGRHVALRPEMTPTLARMVAAREKDFRKPLKWFCCPQFFRYEKQQRGRLREFYQFNADIVGESSVAADVELICLAIDLFRAFGFSENDFIVRICDRSMWVEFFLRNGGSDLRSLEFLQVIDKIEREDAESLESKLKVFGISLAQVKEFMAEPLKGEGLKSTFNELERRSFDRFVEADAAIVRGLAYYTGLVFEIFDRSKNERALAGGGRYDNLLNIMSDGKVNLPALGFGMGEDRREASGSGRRRERQEQGRAGDERGAQRWHDDASTVRIELAEHLGEEPRRIPGPVRRVELIPNRRKRRAEIPRRSGRT